MKFDAIIIGGGLAGLTCGIRLSKQHKKCLIISSGQSALHFSSGSFDLLNAVGDKTIENPIDELEQLRLKSPQHPYLKIGKARVAKYVEAAKELLLEAGVEVIGEANKNHYRITPLGHLKPSWLTVKDFATSHKRDSLPWKSVAIFNITGFLDFHPDFIADEFIKMGIHIEKLFIDMPILKTLRKNPSELRATNIARVFENKEHLDSLAEIIKKGVSVHDTIIFPACLGLKSDSVEVLSKKVGRPIYLIPTFPPSIVGIRSQQLLVRHFEKLGGVYMLGDNVKKVLTNEEGADIHVFTENHGNIPFITDKLVLATGSYFSQGLIASFSRIFEPIMDLDVDYCSNRENWTSKDFFDEQDYQRFGVSTTENFNVIKEGTIFQNMYAIGAILSGFSPIKEGCGSGVSMLTALAVADSILNT